MTPAQAASLAAAIKAPSAYSLQSAPESNRERREYILSIMLAENMLTQAEYDAAMAEEAENYRRIAELLKDGHIRRLMQEGADEKTAARKAEKMAIEDARFLLPNACSTKMIVTMNARSLNNFFRHRCCQRAQWEIRELADEMLRLVNEVAPALFARSGPPCVSGACPEGSMSCGRAAEMRKKYAFLKGDEMV